MTLRVVLLIVAMAGCTSNSDAPQAVSRAVEGSAAPVAATPTAPATPPAPANPKLAAARCGEPCLFLTDTPFAKLQDTYAAACAGMKTADLGFENCKQIAYMRNCIYAAHGLVSKRKKWKVFTAKPWYEANAAFESKMISAVERDNVRELYNRGKACAASMKITGTDYKLLEQWFADARKSKITTPEIALEDVDGLAKSPQVALAKWLEIRLAKANGKGSMRFKDATVSYADQLPEAFKDMKGTLRTILVDLTDTSIGEDAAEVTNLLFVVDDKDQIRAVSASSYLND